MLHSTDALCAITNPTVNSYRRINAPATTSGATWSPQTISYGGNNRTHTIRIPDADRFEFRLADGAANPYLLPAALIAAGLEGIASNRNPGVRSDVNTYVDTEFARTGKATGAWQQTAQFKLTTSGLADIVVPIACSDDARARVEIMTRAELRARDYYQQAQFSTITYIGDGVWDGVASTQLNYNFIGIGTGDRALALRANGARSVFANYQNSRDFIDCLQQLDRSPQSPEN